MSGSDKWFRWSFNLFIFLMCFQMGMLIFLKSLFYQAERRMKNNEAEVNFRCGDFNSDESYWSLQDSLLQLREPCMDRQCPGSLWVNPNEQNEELHVVSVEKAMPSRLVDGQRQQGHYVNLDLKLSEKPTTLVLVSQNMMIWNLENKEKETKESLLGQDAGVSDDSVSWFTSSVTPTKWSFSGGANLKELIVVSPELIWLEGVPAGTKVTYFSKDQLCAYPTAWQEIANSRNQFRRLAMALQSYTGLQISSFQGKKVGGDFQVPFRPILASHREHESQQQRQLASSTWNKTELGLQWQRKGQTLKAVEYRYRDNAETKSLSLPDGVKDAYFELASRRLYLIRNHQFGWWDSDKKQFTAIHLPLRLPALYWPTAMTFNPLKSEIYIYNEDRGGEIFKYNVVTHKWGVWASQVGYSVVGLLFDTDQEKLFASRFERRKISEILTFSSRGQLERKKALRQPLDFAKNSWHAQLIHDHQQVWLKVTYPARPEGDLYPYEQL